MKLFNKDNSPTPAATPSPASSSTKTSSSKSFFSRDSSKKNQAPAAPSPRKQSSKKKSKKEVVQPEAAPRKKKRRVVAALATTAVVGGAGFAVWKYALGSPTTTAEALEGLGDFTNVLKDGLKGLDFGKFFDNDPSAGDANVYTWRSDFIQPDNGGLHLTLLNALDDTWQDEFSDAVSDWAESPALSLEIDRVDVDYECNRVDGAMVICNANFGETGWVGINQNEIKRDVIVSSVTKMNEFYLRNAEYEHRRYTMCHEVGHGFGLPHTDEDPYNENLGNCLDYTKDPGGGGNLYPGAVNLQKLKNMYLSRRKLSSVEGKDGSVIETHMLVVDPSLIEDYESYEEV